ncbi:MAG: glutamate--tRNA ligase, partial [Flavobacteriaceae bacterium]
SYGPYRQSERKHLYGEYARKLVESGNAYYAFDTPEELELKRKEQEAEGKTFIYNWNSRAGLINSLSMNEEDAKSLMDQGKPYVIRYLMPAEQKMQIQDLIRGQIEIDTSTLDDKILFKSDGMPTYHLANVVDDHLMEISHVIRGEEWLPSLALHYQLYSAFGWEAPAFAHLPLILKPVGKGKLSKRDGEKMGFPIFPLSWENSIGYRESGYYPAAVLNFLAFLGWNPGGEEEILTLDELIEQFSLDRVHKSGARFDPEKTKWYNHKYLQERSDNVLVEDLKHHIDVDFSAYSDNYLLSVVQLLKERADFIHDIWDEGQYFFNAPNSYNEKAVKKHWKEGSSAIMTDVASVLDEIADFSSEKIEERVKSWIAKREIGFGKVMAPLRLVIVGDLKGPQLFDIIALLGKEESLGRITNAVELL